MYGLASWIVASMGTLCYMYRLKCCCCFADDLVVRLQCYAICIVDRKPSHRIPPIDGQCTNHRIAIHCVYNGTLVCGFNVRIKGLRVILPVLSLSVSWSSETEHDRPIVQQAAAAILLFTTTKYSRSDYYIIIIIFICSDKNT